MTAARLALATVAVLLVVSAPAAAAEGSRARLVAVTAPPPEHFADPGLKTYVYRFGPHRIGPFAGAPIRRRSTSRSRRSGAAAWRARSTARPDAS